MSRDLLRRRVTLQDVADRNAQRAVARDVARRGNGCTAGPDGGPTVIAPGITCSAAVGSPEAGAVCVGRNDRRPDGPYHQRVAPTVAQARARNRALYAQFRAERDVIEAYEDLD